MRRLLRWIFTGLVTLSLVLGLALTILWVRSYWQSGYVMMRRGRSWSVWLDKGLVQFDVSTSHRMHGQFSNTPAGWSHVQYGPAEPYSDHWQFSHQSIRSSGAGPGGGMWFSHNLATWVPIDAVKSGSVPTPMNIINVEGSMASIGSTWGVPAWFILLLLAILPAYWLTVHRKRRRREWRLSRGLCVHCGYDLRATPDCCPECGKVPEASTLKK